MKVAILNLMPTKEVTEKQLKSLLPPHARYTLLTPATHVSKNTSARYLAENYTTPQKVKDERFDIFIITGAPVEHLDFDRVDYWEELKQVLDFTRTNAAFNIFICWAAQAALKHFYDIGKQPLREKCFGIFEHEFNRKSVFYAGFPDSFLMPHSRHTTINKTQIENNGALTIDAWFGNEISVISSKDGRDLYITGHPEYDAETLDLEYKRDLQAGKNITPPVNYYPENDIKKMPPNTWRKEAVSFYQNIIKHAGKLKGENL